MCRSVGACFVKPMYLQCWDCQIEAGYIMVGPQAVMYVGQEAAAENYRKHLSSGQSIGRQIGTILPPRGRRAD